VHEKAAQIIFHPVTEELAAKIQGAGGLAEPSNLKTLKFHIGEQDYKFHRQGKIRLDFKKFCNFCGEIFDFEAEECPSCLARIVWHCPHCDSLKSPLIETILIDGNKNEKRIWIVPSLQNWAWKIAENIGDGYSFHDVCVKCPDCEKRNEPTGLTRIDCIGDTAIEKHYTSYFLEIGSERHIILDYKIIRDLHAVR